VNALPKPGEPRVFADVDELHTALLDMEPKSFVSRYILEPVPFAFSGDLQLWIDWKETLAVLLYIDAYDIVMTGSASMGYSLNPMKSFKAFDNLSDIDCGVISEHYFNVAWRHLRQSQVAWLGYPKKLRTALTSHRTQYIFDGTIATDRIMSILPFGRDWQGALEIMSEVPPTVGRDVKLRIYKDFDALRHYQSRNVEALRNNLSPEDDAEIIVAEDPAEEAVV